VVSALGRLPDTDCLGEESTIRRGVLGNIVVDPITLETARSWVFAAGDVVTGGATVIEAIAAGQKSAVSIDRFLRAAQPDSRFKLPRPRRRVEVYAVQEESPEKDRSDEPPAVKCRFAEVVNLSAETAIKEARRCLRCDIG
jgi:NADPH-dependent glutamate synthase beta subunit-like oxidoreductase